VAILGLDVTTGVQVWIKSSYELSQTKDASMAVILAATAVDCELSFLFSKWTGIAQLPQRGHLLTDEECAEMLREFGGIQDKLKKVTKLLVPEGLQHFVSTTDKWRDVILKDFPELDITCLIKSIDRALFWPRNRILHGGHAATAQQGERCVKVAQICLGIFRDMDYVKRRTLP